GDAAEEERTGRCTEPAAAHFVDAELASGAAVTLIYARFIRTSKPRTDKILSELKLHGFFTANKSALAQFPPELDAHAFARAVIYRHKAVSESGSVTAAEEIESICGAGFDPKRPLVTYFLRTEAGAEDLSRFIAAAAAMRIFDRELQTAVCFVEEESYAMPLRDAAVSASGASAVTIVNLGKHNVLNALKTFSAAFYDNSFEPELLIRNEELGIRNEGQITNNGNNSSFLIPHSPLALPTHGGGFLSDGSFAFSEKDKAILAPWSNVISVPEAGTVVTGRGGAYTFLGNARERCVTEFTNHPLFDEPSERLFVVADKGRYSVPEGNTRVIHGAGYTAFEFDCGGLAGRYTHFLDTSAGAKIFLVELERVPKANAGARIELSLKLQMGNGRDGGFLTFVRAGGCLKISNPLNGMDAYFSCSGSFEYAYDTALSILTMSTKIAGAKHKKADTAASPVTEIAETAFSVCGSEYVPFNPRATLSACTARFSGLNPVTAETGDAAFDMFFNHRLMLQTLSSRFYGRAGYYQAGGAFGFRDQLQDCAALLYHDPALVKEHIVRCASKQYAEGDVQHWWHEGLGGLRTKTSDDLLFLPYVTAMYIRHTGDISILECSAPYLCSSPLSENEPDRYENPLSRGGGTICEHCVKAIQYSAQRRGERGLCLMGTGDWNDAMNRVGAGGQGESVWLSMFLYLVIKEFLPYVPDEETRSEFKEDLARLKIAVGKCFEDERFYRAFSDLGEALGRAGAAECALDLLCQSFAVISGIADKPECDVALDTARGLVDRGRKLVKLLWPPFQKTDAGYISEYPPGVRENGGQYTHAAAWYAIALCMAGRDEEAFEIMDLLNPINRCLTAEEAAVYRGEPYALAADVYADGRAGWTWYTGSAAWYYVAACEYVLGVKKRGNRLYFDPHLPARLLGATVKYRHKDKEFVIKLVKDGEKALYLDGRRYHNIDHISLSNEYKNIEYHY
ncbi:MAG: hypothetical protein FWE62_04865, partial [Firmicutes bacterium]|nr:hypothetical protein [Bacillota bacterium]